MKSKTKSEPGHHVMTCHHVRKYYSSCVRYNASNSVVEPRLVCHAMQGQGRRAVHGGGTGGLSYRPGHGSKPSWPRMGGMGAVHVAHSRPPAGRVLT